jgi:hypothetical protein
MVIGFTVLDPRLKYDTLSRFQSSIDRVTLEQLSSEKCEGTLSKGRASNYPQALGVLSFNILGPQQHLGQEYPRFSRSSKV